MKYPDRNQTSAVPGSIGPRVDLDSIRQRSLEATLAEIGKSRITIEAKGDGVDWARRVLARVEAGEEVPMRAQQLAREALELVVVIRKPGEDDAV